MTAKYTPVLKPSLQMSAIVIVLIFLALVVGFILSSDPHAIDLRQSLDNQMFLCVIEYMIHLM